jgi:hypothetical protein
MAKATLTESSHAPGGKHEKHIKRVLDLLTVTPTQKIDSLAHEARKNAHRLRKIIASENLLAVGLSEKIEGKDRRTGKLSLTFYVEQKVPLSELKPSMMVPPSVPESLSGAQQILTDVKVIGKLRPEINAKRNPFQPGNSIGHIEATAGTFGAVVTRDDELFILSNSHVLALCGLAKKGDAIVYPGKADGGIMDKDHAGMLAGFKKFIDGAGFLNRVDCAIAKPTPARLNKLVSRIKGLGLPTGITEPVRGMKVTKVGRTSGKTIGEVQDVHFRFRLDYGGDVGEIGFRDQVLCSRYTEDGDSGSIVIDKATGRAVGLHFAGAEGGSVFNPIDQVLKALRVKLVTA